MVIALNGTINFKVKYLIICGSALSKYENYPNMKITFVLTTVGFQGGIRSTATLAERLIKRGHEVLVVSTPRRPPSLRQQVRSLLKGQGWVSTTLKPPSHFDNVDVPHRVIDRFRPITDEDVPDADIVVATWWQAAKWVAQFSDAKGVKVYFIRGYAANMKYLPKEQVEMTYSLPMHKITISDQLVDWLRTCYGDNKVSLVPNSVDTELFYAPPRGKQPSPTVGMMYSTIYWKGGNIILRAFSLASQKIPNLRLVAFGSQRPSSNLPLPPNTEYIYQPPQNAIRDIYAKCDAWLFGSSSEEGFGNPILEAMACRTPVIGTPVGAAPKILADGAGVLLKSENPEEMAQAIERFCRLSESEWQTMSNVAYAKATGYTWDDAVELCEKAFCTAIDRWKQGEFSDYDMKNTIR